MLVAMKSQLTRRSQVAVHFAVNRVEKVIRSAIEIEQIPPRYTDINVVHSHRLNHDTRFYSRVHRRRDKL